MFKGKKNARVTGITHCFQGKLSPTLRDKAAAMSNMGGKLKVTPCLKCLNYCYDNERRPVEECNSKMCTVALSLRGTICPSEWSSGVHDWTM